MKIPIRILHLENAASDAALVGSELLKHHLNFERKVVDSKQGFIDALDAFSPDIILSEYATPSLNTIGALEILHKNNLQIPFILVTSTASDELALRMIRLGADDYVMKDRLNKLPVIVLNVLEKYRMQREWQRLTTEIREKQKKADEAIKVSIERYELLAKATSDMIWDWNLITGEIYRSKEGWKRIFSAADYDIPTTPEAWISRVHPEDRERMKNMDASLFDSADINVFTADCRILNDNDEYINIEDKGYVIRDEKGKAIRIVGVTKNNTSAKKSEELLKASEERYRHLFEHNPSSIFLWDIDTLKIVDANETAAKVYGYTKEEFCTLSVLDLRKKEEHAKILSLRDRLKNEPQNQNFGIWQHISKAGDLLYMDISSQNITYHGKTVVMAMANNVTDKVVLQKYLDERKTIEQKEITDAVITAQEKERELIGCELHDNVNQILATSLLYLGMAKKDSVNNAAMAETENMINSAIQEIRNLTHSLIAPSLEETSLQTALENIIRVTGINSSFSIHAYINCNNENNIPGKLKLSIYRIVQEQFSNIQKYARANNVTISLHCNPDQIELHIKDDGIGFDTSKKSEGVGLKNIKTRAALYNGKVSVVSSPGNGCEISTIFFKPGIN
jgi:PAS domain S-box-containing protein